MGCVQTIGDLNPETKGLVELQRTFLQAIGERLSLEVLHDEEFDPAFVTHVVQRTDMGMIQARDRARFSLETFFERGAIRQMARKHFDGDRAIEPRVFGLVDLPHAAGSDRS